MPRQAIHPGTQLAEQLSQIGISAAELARQIEVPTNRVTEIINGERAVTGDSALRLGHFFGNTAEFWLHLQLLFELAEAEAKAGDHVSQLPTLASFVQSRAGRIQEKLI